MAIKLNRTAEPLSFAARTDTPRHPSGLNVTEVLILARSRAGDVLENELGRYCDGLVRGRSFLIAGHRGSGKSTLVDNVILHYQWRALEQRVRAKPLPVYVQGPLLFPPLVKPASAPESVAPAAAAAGSVAWTLLAGSVSVAPSDKSRDDEDDLEQRVMIQVAQGLHQAVAKEYGERFHLHARRELEAGARNGNELVELAARFQIELTEAPPPSRLQEFWNHAGLAGRGLLFERDHSRGSQQGMREMVALTGVSHVYQRISGKLEERDIQRSSQNRTSETSGGLESKWAELVKPLSALAVGGAVGTAGAFAGDPVSALVLGALAAAGSSLLFKFSIGQQRERKLDRTFMPDLTTKTLHRVMPELFERLFAAGLAPVFVVDELDKVDDLYDRIHQLLNSMKKLFAERAFTCLLVDRGFYEQLHWLEEQERRPPPAPGEVAVGSFQR